MGRGKLRDRHGHTIPHLNYQPVPETDLGSEEKQTAPKGRIHKHGPAVVRPRGAKAADEARPLMTPDLDLRQVERELYQD